LTSPGNSNGLQPRAGKTKPGVSLLPG
jgi:hypothetical protein